MPTVYDLHSHRWHLTSQLRLGEISKNKLMNKNQIVLACLALFFAFIPIGRAQTTNADSAVSLEADAAGLSLLPSVDVPVSGTFWLVTSPTNGINGITAPFPGVSSRLSDAKVYVMANGIFLVDDTAGNAGASAPEVLAQADAVSNLIVKVQTPPTSQCRTMGVHAMDDSGTPVPTGDGSGGGDEYTNDLSSSIPLNTNLLYFQITDLSGGLAYLLRNNFGESNYDEGSQQKIS